MGKVFKGQTALTIQRVLGTDITGATTVLIKYKKPSLKEGQWTATIVDAVTGTIKYDVQNATDLDEYGNWVIWGHVTFASGTVAASEPTVMKVWQEGEIE